MTAPGGRPGGATGGAGRQPAGSRRGGDRRWRLVRARNDAVPASVRRFMRRARQRRLRAARPWAVICGVLGVAGLAAWLVYGTSVFGVRDVRVTGTEILSPVQVRQAAEVPNGIPLARVDLDAIRARVGALVPVDRVTAYRDWPGTLVIAVVERTAVAVVPQGGRFGLLDGAGVVFQTVGPRPAHLPVVRLATPGPQDPATRAALQVLAALTEELRAQLVAVAVEGSARIRLELRGERKVIWGDATESATKAKVATALLRREATTIDVSAPDVVTFR